MEEGIEARSLEALGSVIEIKLPHESASLFPLCFSQIQRFERQFSRFRQDSELERLNRHLGVWQKASDELIALAARAEELRAQTDGYFDITLKERLEALGYDPHYSFKEKPPRFDPMALVRAMGPPIRLDRKGGRILLNKQIEFGGLGKGYMLDQLSTLLQSHGVEHYFINAGGDVYGKRGHLGSGPAAGGGRHSEGPWGEPWTVLLEHPDDPARAIGYIELDGQALAGSSPNRRNWAGGKKHHLINPKTREPVKGVKAIFVLGKNGMEADAYAKGIFCAGFEAGIALSTRLPVKILYIAGDNRTYQTPGFDVKMFG